MSRGPNLGVDDDILARVHIERDALEETIESIANSASELENIAKDLAG